MANKIGDWIQTYTGKQFYPLDPDIELIDLMDIAHTLSLQCKIRRPLPLFLFGRATFPDSRQLGAA